MQSPPPSRRRRASPDRLVTDVDGNSYIDYMGTWGPAILGHAHPAVIDLLQTEEKEAVQEAERMFARRIVLNARKEYHIEQFDLQGG